jgi:hypothetical protein
MDYTSTLFHLFGLNPSISSDLSTAPYCRFADGSKKDNDYWLQASPVHLQPDGKSLLLFDAAHLRLSLDEAEQLATLVQEHFCHHGWRLEVYDPQRWYLGLKRAPDLQTYPLDDVIGRNIDHYLPTGRDAMDWHSILNELQMLLHTAKVNLLREGRGMLPVNGLWLHGGGFFHSIEQTVYTGASGDGPLLRGMAQAAGIEVSVLPQENADHLSGEVKHLVVYDRLQRSLLSGDTYDWIEEVERFNSWLESLLGATQRESFNNIQIYSCNGQIYKIDLGFLRRFWKRKKPLSHFIVS